jgi:hypothetical protein
VTSFSKSQKKPMTSCPYFGWVGVTSHKVPPLIGKSRVKIVNGKSQNEPFESKSRPNWLRSHMGFNETSFANSGTPFHRDGSKVHAG